MINSIQTYQVTIACGLRESYDGPIHTLRDARLACQAYVNKVGLCVTFTPTEFIYTHGREPGVLIGLMNCPRFPTTPSKIKERAITLAQILKDALGQQRVSVICTDETILLGDSQ
jgi:hypothetical protein